MSVTAYIGMGANLGDAAHSVREAMRSIGNLPETHVIATSNLYRSAPVGYLDQPDFVNAVIAVDTTLEARALLQSLHDIEAYFGRQRSFRNAPRTLDLDLLLYGSTSVGDEDLTIPHPRMQSRAFVMVPLAEIAPSLTMPDGNSVAQCAALCDRTGLQQIIP